MFYKKAAFKNFAILTGKNTFRPATFIKERLQHRYFPVNIAKFLRTPILKNICKRLLLKYQEWFQGYKNVSLTEGAHHQPPVRTKG